MFNWHWYPYTDINKINLDWILEILSKLRGGLTGQFLKKKTGGDYDFEWSAPAYSELESKPTINGVTVEGDLAGHDLSLADLDDLTYVTPEMFGAAGDGVADDTAAVAEAFTYPAVWLKHTYLVDSDITSDARFVAGEGTIISSAANCLTFTGPISIKGITIEMGSQVDQIGITAQKAIDVDGITVKNGRVGIFVNNAYDRCTIRNSVLKDQWGDQCRAVRNDYAGSTLIENCFIENISNDLTMDADGVSFWQADDTEDKNTVRIIGCEFHNCRGRYIKAQSQHVEIEGCYLHNDVDFGTITYFHGIDVQKGNSVIRRNRIVAPDAICLQIRDTPNPNHVVENNSITGISPSSGTQFAIGAIKYSDSANANISIIGNDIDWGNAPSINCPYLPASIYEVKNNRVFNRTSDQPMKVPGTFDATTRYIIMDNTCDYTYFITFTVEANVWGDRTVRVSKDIAPGSVLPHTCFVGNTATLTSHSYAWVQCEGNAQANGYLIFCTNAFGFFVFDRNGTQINV